MIKNINYVLCRKYYKRVNYEDMITVDKNFHVFENCTFVDSKFKPKNVKNYFNDSSESNNRLDFKNVKSRVLIRK
jgi:hypothetical protein